MFFAIIYSIEIYEFLRKKISIFSEEEKNAQSDNIKLGDKNDNSGGKCSC